MPTKKLYRVLRDVSIGEDVHKKGELIVLSLSPETTRIAVEVAGTLAEVQSPPLAALPGWSIIGKKLSSLKIETISHLLMADPVFLAAKLDESMSVVEGWQKAAKKLITGS